MAREIRTPFCCAPLLAVLLAASGAAAQDLTVKPAPANGLAVIPIAPSDQPAWAAPTGPAAPRADDTRPDLRPLAVLGLSAAIQAVGTGLTLLFAGVDYGLNDVSVETGYGVMLGVTPIADSVLGWVVMRRSTRYDAPLFSTLIGAYLGAAAAYVCVWFYSEADDPEVDGKYDEIYFQGDGANHRKGTGTLALFLAPVLLPAIGAGRGALAGRRPLEAPKRVTLGPPIPIALSNGARGDAVPGVLVSGTF